jgi:hypothetical protein
MAKHEAVNVKRCTIMGAVSWKRRGISGRGLSSLSVEACSLPKLIREDYR